MSELKPFSSIEEAKLGMTVQALIPGFVGTLTSITHRSSSWIQFNLTAKSEENKEPETHSFDWQECAPIDEKFCHLAGEPMSFMYNNGDEVRDAPSGFKGVITSKTIFLNGCIFYHVTPKVKADNKFEEPLFIEQKRLIRVRKASETTDKEPEEKKGGPTSRLPRRI